MTARRQIIDAESIERTETHVVVRWRDADGTVTEESEPIAESKIKLDSSACCALPDVLKALKAPAEERAEAVIRALEMAREVLKP